MSLKKIIDLDLLGRFLDKVKELIPTRVSELENDARYMSGMTILSYGKSTWADFMEAYGDNKVVYCRASSGSNPASGSQTRMAFMAYVNNQTTPTEVEFQYYRSVNAHTDAQQGDQVYVYKLNKTNGWSVTVRNAFSKLVTGTGLTHTYSNGTITIANSEIVPGVVSTAADGLAPQLPNESTTTKFLRQDATWAVPEYPVTSVNGSTGAVTVDVPSKTSDLQNDSGFITGITSADVTTALGYTPPRQDTTYESKAAASGGTDVSLVTTGEKYTWNKRGLPAGGYIGQVLMKSLSFSDYSVYWAEIAQPGTLYLKCNESRTYQDSPSGTFTVEAYGGSDNMSNYTIDFPSGLRYLYYGEDYSGYLGEETTLKGELYRLNHIDIVGRYDSEWGDYRDYATCYFKTISSRNGTPIIKVVTVAGYSGDTIADSTTTVTYSEEAISPGASDYSDLSNKPSIQGVTLSGNKTANDLGLALKTDVPAYESKAAVSGGTDVSLVTTGEKYIWNNKGTYSKPSGGIPDSDIASAATWNAKGNGTITGIKMNGASKGTSGVVDLGTVITAHQDISGKADKSATVSNVAYDATNKKITETVNGTTSDVVSVATIKTDLTLVKGDVGLGNVDNVKQYSASNPPPYPVTSVNGDTGAVTVDVPTKTSDLTNDSGFITSSTGGIPAGGSANEFLMKSSGTDYDTRWISLYSGEIPFMDSGSGDPGLSSMLSRRDHRHPTDTSRQAKITASGILKGDGSGGVSAATAGTDYITPATLHSPWSVHDSVTSYAIVAGDANKTIRVNQTNTTVTLTQAVSTNMANGTEIGILLANTAANAVLTVVIPSGRAYAQGNAFTKVKITGCYGLCTIKKMWAATADVWLVTAPNVEVIS